MNTITPFLIFSVELAGRPAEINRALHVLAQSDLLAKSVPFTETRGHYAGSDERSLLVPDSPYNRGAVTRLVTEYEQESILAVDANGRARLEYLDGREPVSLGQFVEVSDTAGLDGWTELNGRFYTCR